MKSAVSKLWLLIAFLLCSATAWSQVKKISGRITDEENKPLSGVSILVKGKTTGTQTSASGEYSIEASEGDVLVFSHTSFTAQEITVGASDVIDVSLKAEAAGLGEVVVVGYGTQSRRNITSSIAKLDKQVLANAPRSNVGTALQGTVSGLRVVNTSGTPGATPYMLLRGGASINSPQAPLVVVDGIIRAFNDIPSQDIASIELLKDAAATAIYGARANNGVILITTNQARAGSAQITYKYTYGHNERRDNYNYLNAKDFIYLNRLGNLNSQVNLATVNTRRGYGLVTTPADLASFDIRAYGPTTSHLLQMGWDTVGDPYGGTIIFKDHSGEIEDLVFRNTNTHDHYVNVMGGNDRGKYYGSFDYYKEDGVIVGSSYQRYSGDINGAYKIKPNLEISSGATFSTSSQLGTITSEINTLYRNLAIWPTFNPWLDSAKTKPNPGNGIADGNPLYWIGKLERVNEVNRITGNASVKYDVKQVPGLSLKAGAYAYLFESLNQSFQNATQTYTQMFATPPTFSTARDAIMSFSRTFQTQYNLIANYGKTFWENHNVSAMLGAEYFGQKNTSMQVHGQNAPTDDIPTPNASTTFASGNNTGLKSEFRLLSHFGRLNYDYDQRFLVTLVYRSDATSSLSEENRTGFFPGMSAGWNIHREKFYQGSFLSKHISTLKPRISYGVNGNIAGIGNYDVQGVYSSQGNYNGIGGFLNTGIINSDLRWEKSKTTDVGIDIGLLRNKVTIIFDYFDRRTSDLLTDLTLPSYIGFNTVKTNLGTFQNKGIELAVNANILKLQNGFTWDIGANATHIKNKILELPFNGNPNNRQGGLQVFDPKTGQVVWVGGLQEGQPLGAIYGYQQVSIFSDAAEVVKIANTRIDLVGNISGPGSTFGAGKITAGDVNWLDVDKNDTIDSRDQVYLGNINPDWTGGFTTTLSFKNFSLYSQFEFALGHTIYNDLVARTLGQYQGTFNFIDWQKDAWSPTNPNSDISKVYYADQLAAPSGKKNYTRGNNANQVLNSNNSRYYEKGDYLACREITLSYQFTRSLLSKTKVLSQARVYASMNNWFYITSFSGASPESPVNGIYAGTYPTPKSVVLGVQITF
ncbi:MAG TPA: SusC/RagA family TonB-linked outer membrane protein [Chitinophagaceae bacterium]